MTTTVPTPSPEQTAVVVEQAVEYYSAAWSAYIVAALIFLAIVIWFTRKAKPWWRIPLWAAIAAGSLTPAASTPDQTWHAPAIIVAILGFDLNGMAGLAQGLVPMITWFVGFVLLFTIAHIVLQRLPRKAKTTPTTDGPVSENEREKRQEPKLQ